MTKGRKRRMGLFRVECKIENVADAGRFFVVPGLIVDTGSELTWIPRGDLERIGVVPKKQVGFRMADGTAITRDVGFAVIRHDQFETVDEVVFGQPGDLSLLGARTLEGMNVRVEPTTKRLVSAGPIIAAASA
jgi:predicted aspartyl protease